MYNYKNKKVILELTAETHLKKVETDRTALKTWAREYFSVIQKCKLKLTCAKKE